MDFKHVRTLVEFRLILSTSLGLIGNKTKIAQRKHAGQRYARSVPGAGNNCHRFYVRAVPSAEMESS